MEKYKPIRELMAQGEFRKAMDHLSRILQKNPNDKEAQQLEYTCREMIHIQNTCADENTEQKEVVTVDEYVSVYTRRFMKKLSGIIIGVLSQLPSEWQQKLKVDHFRGLEKRFTCETDDQKDWLWEMLFWDTRRRIILFTSLIAALVFFSVLLVWLAFGNSTAAGSWQVQNISSLGKAAADSDADAQYLLGRKYYYGENVPRNETRGVFWLTQAARSGHAQAAALLQKHLAEKEVTVDKSMQLWKSPN